MIERKRGWTIYPLHLPSLPLAMTEMTNKSLSPLSLETKFLSLIFPLLLNLPSLPP